MMTATHNLKWSSSGKLQNWAEMVSFGAVSLQQFDFNKM